MYNINDRKTYVKEIQKYLNSYLETLNRARVPIDGIMGKKTRDAVSFFQNNNGINPSGRVDEFTHTLLYGAFKEKSELSDISDTIVTNQGFPLSKNMQNNDVLILNTLLDSLLKTYPNIERVNVTEYFDTKTERAVKDMQKILGFKENGTVDKRTFSRLWKENRLSNESHFGKMR